MQDLTLATICAIKEHTLEDYVKLYHLRQSAYIESMLRTLFLSKI